MKLTVVMGRKKLRLLLEIHNNRPTIYGVAHSRVTLFAAR
jgi:hypothetical protein